MSAPHAQPPLPHDAHQVAPGGVSGRAGQAHGGQPYGGPQYASQPYGGQPYPGQSYPGLPPRRVTNWAAVALGIFGLFTSWIPIVVLGVSAFVSSKLEQGDARLQIMVVLASGLVGLVGLVVWGVGLAGHHRAKAPLEWGGAALLLAPHLAWLLLMATWQQW